MKHDESTKYGHKLVAFYEQILPLLEVAKEICEEHDIPFAFLCRTDSGAEENTPAISYKFFGDIDYQTYRHFMGTLMNFHEGEL